MSKLAHPDGRRRPKFMKRSWFKEHRRLVIVGAAVLVVAIVVIVGLWLGLGSHPAKTNPVGEPKEKAEPTRYYSPLTGRETTRAKTTAPVLAVMIENSPEARPQSGLTDAGVVFEAVAEGGITRFIALYQETEPSLIGPVRSVRPYYLEWAAAFDAGIAHVGGSAEALAMVRSGNYGVDLDQFYNDAAYWRVKDRAAPHNVFTDHAHLLELLKSKGQTTSSFSGFPRQDVKPKTDPKKTASDQTAAESETPAVDINLNISTTPYNVAYHYDAASQTYQRSVGGKPHMSRAKDGQLTQVAPDVVITLHVNQGLMADGLHTTIATTGSGEAFVFQDGQVAAGTWSKDSPASQLKFFDKNGQEIQLRRGQTWITAVPNRKAITWQ